MCTRVVIQLLDGLRPYQRMNNDLYNNYNYNALCVVMYRYLFRYNNIYIIFEQ